jgi:hypothetical protein
MSEQFQGWAVLELMGHRRLAGQLSEQNVGGAAFIRIDVPSAPPVTQFYAPGAVYAITPCTEEVARAVAAKTQTDPVSLLGISLSLPEPDDDEEECPHGRNINLDCPDCAQGQFEP